MALAHWCCRWDQVGDGDDVKLVMLIMLIMTMTVMLFLQKLDSSNLSASSMQKWQAAPLCNGKFKVVKFGKDLFGGIIEI